MKPDDWSAMSKSDQKELATRLLNSHRGNLLIGQALAKAVTVMRAAEDPETSNIEDMEILGEVLFQPWFDQYDPNSEMAKQIERVTKRLLEGHQ